ncbi:MAG: response regulator transcription factor [Gemmatimonadetes bacterium]|nr:response regulator transcription factor [Gemmatimonadota bacterium]
MTGGDPDLRLLLWTDARLYREWLARSLEAQEGIAETRIAGNADEAAHALRQSRTDVAVLDVTLPQLAEAVAAVHHLAPECRVVLFGLNDVDSEVLGCAQLGIAGYVTRQATVKTLAAAIRNAQRGELVCPPRVAGRLLDLVAAMAAERRAEPEALPLTPREFEIAELIERGLSNKEIARSTSIEVATVKNHVHNILEKLNVRRRGEAAARLRRRRQRTGGQGVPTEGWTDRERASPPVST